MASHACNHFAFVFFKNADKGRSGMRLAISDDGRTFTSIPNHVPPFIPKVGEQKLLRDPSIAIDPETGIFHMVWTTSWFGKTIGHATSADLLHWSEPRAIAVMADFPETANSWAPELFYDTANKQFVVAWASTLANAFLETAGPNPALDNHRIYATTTRDFLNFSPTKLYYDPGFSVIDATLLADNGALYLFIKDERDDPPRKYVQWCVAETPTGPFGPLSPPITVSWAEGPTAWRVGDEIIVAFDLYKEGKFGAVASSNMVDWRDATNDVTFPEGASHGTVFPISSQLYRLLAGS